MTTRSVSRDIAAILAKPYARLVMPDGEDGYFAEIVEFPGCFATGDSAAAALAMLERVAADWLRAAWKQGQTIPPPLEAQDFSGKLVLRMPRGLHQRAAMQAAREGVSLNQFIVTCLAEQTGMRAVMAKEERPTAVRARA